MDALDTFSRTFLPATGLGRLPAAMVARHVGVPHLWVRLASAAEMRRLDEALKQAFRAPFGVVEPAFEPVAAAGAFRLAMA